MERLTRIEFAFLAWQGVADTATGTVDEPGWAGYIRPASSPRIRAERRVKVTDPPSRCRSAVRDRNPSMASRTAMTTVGRLAEDDDERGCNAHC
jgi:hypothetical protein